MAVRETPFRRSMVGGRTLWGVDYKLAVLNLMSSVLMIGVAHYYWWILFAIGIHALLHSAYKADPDVLAVYVRYVREAHTYEPWPHPGSRAGRPPGWG
ncbi:MAG: VirB3 family type IV secretion system protein [Sinobacteraceae bacterium]|nr:VirB3 family type IV secretion system protein [Nevskiaceae bacterium]